MKKGFTLIEMLVVVLIIGILAAVALPQYRLAIGKVQYSTLKTITKSIYDASNRYYLINNNAPQKSSDLDIDLDIKEENSVTSVSFTLKNDISCIIIRNDTTSTYVYCEKLIFGKKMRLYIDRYNPYGSTSKFTNRSCLVYSTDTNDIQNKICQQETGNSSGGCSDDYCSYRYLSGYF